MSGFGPVFSANSTDIGKDCQALLALYSDLPVVIGLRFLKAAMNLAVKPFIPELKQATPRRKGGLRRSIKFRTKFYEHKKFVRVASNIHFAKGGSHAWWIANGTKDRYVTTRNKKKLKTPAFRGHVTANHMMVVTRAKMDSVIVGRLEGALVEKLENAVHTWRKIGLKWHT